MPSGRRFAANGDILHRGLVEEVRIETLRPTQMAVGMRAVTYKRRKVESRADKPKSLQHILARRTIPAVRGPGDELFIIDHHHFGLALWQAEVERAYVRIVEDLSELARGAFWKRMEASGWLYPFDEEGQRVPPRRLPIWLHALRHDAFRDLAWEVREAGGYTKSSTPFAEFRWALFFREHIALSTLRRNPDRALERALALCRSRGPEHLPGYRRP